MKTQLRDEWIANAALPTHTERLQAALDYRFGLRPSWLARAAEAFSPRVAGRLRSGHGAAAQHLKTCGGAGAGVPLLTLCEQLRAAAARETGRAREAMDASDFAGALGSTLHRVLLDEYAGAGDYFEYALARPGSARDFRPQTLVGVSAPPDLPVIDPEQSDYTELAALSTRELEIAVTTTGVMLTISRAAILADNVEAIRQTVGAIARAARRTVARRVWSLFTANAIYAPDGVAWFDGAHGNLQSAALSESEVIAAVAKLLAQTLPGTSGERVGRPPRAGELWLIVPHALWDTAWKLNQTTGSALYHLFGERNETIAVNGLLTDTNDWGLCWDAGVLESVRVNYLGGREEPELMLADRPNADALFRADRVMYKTRLEFQVGLLDYRHAVKAAVA